MSNPIDWKCYLYIGYDVLTYGPTLDVLMCRYSNRTAGIYIVWTKICIASCVCMWWLNIGSIYSMQREYCSTQGIIIQGTNLWFNQSTGYNTFDCNRPILLRSAVSVASVNCYKCCPSTLLRPLLFRWSEISTACFRLFLQVGTARLGYSV